MAGSKRKHEKWKMIKLKTSKKAAVHALDLFGHWPEYLFFVLLVIGFVISISARSAFISYVVIFLCGMMAGRLIYYRHEKPHLRFPYYLILAGFIIGYTLGTRYGNWIILITLFLAGGFVSYYLHERGFIRDIPY